MRTDALRIFALLLGIALLIIACDVMDNSDDPLNSYTCPNGTPEADGRAGRDGDQRCAACDVGYALQDNACAIDSTLPDADNDTFPDVIDVDDDNNGLIDIRNLDMLYHMHYNLAGTTYDDEEADTGDGDAGSSIGAPTDAIANCDTATDGVYLCGYELTRDLDFADDAHYASGEVNAEWRPNAANPADADNAGWPGIGGTTNDDDAPAFAARFDGNGNTISNLYMRRGGSVGLFNTTAESAHIHAVTIADAALYGGDTNGRIGALVGVNNGQITESDTSGAITSEVECCSTSIGGIAGLNHGEITDSSADVTVIGGNNENSIGGLVGSNTEDISDSSAIGPVTMTRSASINSRIGGLVGTNTGSIIGSYATGIVDIQRGEGIIGGLVGRNGHTFTAENMAGSIIASYATGAVTAGGETDNAGGLVGQNSNSSRVIASYATGAVHGGGGNDDSVGGLVGSNSSSQIIASYAIGAVHGGGGNADSVGGLVGLNISAQIIASYATGSASDGEGENDNVGGLLGLNNIGGTVIASYATGDADGDSVGRVGRFVGFNATFDSSVFTESYGFGMPTQSGQTVTDADTLQITDSSATTTYAGDTWNNADDDTLNAWDFGTTSQAPALRYADYDGAGTDYTCDMFPATIPGTTMTLDCDTTAGTFTLLPILEQ